MSQVLNKNPSLVNEDTLGEITWQAEVSLKLVKKQQKKNTNKQTKLRLKYTI